MRTHGGLAHLVRAGVSYAPGARFESETRHNNFTSTSLGGELDAQIVPVRARRGEQDAGARCEARIDVFAHGAVNDNARNLDFTGWIVESHGDVNRGPNGPSIGHDQEHAAATGVDDARMGSWTM